MVSVGARGQPGDEQRKMSVHSAPRSGRGGRRFKSCHSDQLSRKSAGFRIPVTMMGTVTPQDLDELAALVEEFSRTPGETDSVRRVQLKEAVTAAFDHVRSLSSRS